mmetsp:Transcript_31005/g.118917  ORF Transcript_31005/g.118917 Transcript_31005/m.118917 type:complete len:132 (-) Transcript_31005:2263-2658(-)
MTSSYSTQRRTVSKECLLKRSTIRMRQLYTPPSFDLRQQENHTWPLPSHRHKRMPLGATCQAKKDSWDDWGNSSWGNSPKYKNKQIPPVAKQQQSSYGGQPMPGMGTSGMSGLSSDTYNGGSSMPGMGWNG